MRPQAAIAAWGRIAQDRTGNLPPLPGVFPDYAAPIERMGEDGRELVLARWGMPPPASALKGRTTDQASRTSATCSRRTGAGGWGKGAAASCRSPFSVLRALLPRARDESRAEVLLPEPQFTLSSSLNMMFVMRT
ncbi:MAG: putative response-associated peptidase [Hyphomicrobiales bacterium]|nr:putative response-associated peptidase [Hyphomicrobiales bacterium]